MKKVAILGSGLMSGPIAGYLMDKCGYRVIMADMFIEKAEKIISGRELGEALHLQVENTKELDNLVAGVDIIICMLPKSLHNHVAGSCIRNGKHMLTTSYETPEVKALAKTIEEKGLLFLYEMGEDPGIDHFGTQLILDEVRQEGGKVLDLKTYGCGLPSYEHNNNPMGYKFNWDPRTVFVAAQTEAAYYKKGKRIEVPGDRLFEHFHLIDIEGLGTFETYPNKDCRKYLEPFGLKGKAISYYRGLLRYSGYCNNMRSIKELGLFRHDNARDLTGITYRQFTASLLDTGADEKETTLENRVADTLGIRRNSDFIHRLKWLGLLDDKQVEIDRGSNLDVLLDIMMKKMAYKPHEKDMIIVHTEALAQFPGKGKEKFTATMMVEGIPFGQSAMSRAVGLPVAIGARLILEGKINETGLQIPPRLPELYKLVLKELETHGYKFKTTRSQ
ncbi:MAG: saccharopine dehydrogenase [bacterium]|nr:saccharopine dehydrogenase [bacterium]